MRVSLFVTCLTDLFAPAVGLATLRVLRHFGCDVDFPAAQTCCGQPQFNNGFPALARPLARRMIRVFANSPCVVTPSASCCAMIRSHYVELCRDDPVWEPRARALAQKTFELVEFLTRVLKVDVSGLALPAPTTVTCHYACHNRPLGMTPADSAALLARVGNVRLVPLDNAGQCCGFGGAFALRYPDISAALAGDKVQAAAATSAAVMMVNDAGCAMNIGGTAHRRGDGFRVRHIAEILADAIGPPPSPGGRP